MKRIVLLLSMLTLGACVMADEPGMAATEDYSATRLNLDIGTDGRIARVGGG
jgi:hypothetical protein